MVKKNETFFVPQLIFGIPEVHDRTLSSPHLYSFEARNLSPVGATEKICRGKYLLTKHSKSVKTESDDPLHYHTTRLLPYHSASKVSSL